MKTIDNPTNELSEELPEVPTSAVERLALLRQRRAEVQAQIIQEEEQGRAAIRAAIAGTGSLETLVEREGRRASLNQVITGLEAHIEEAAAEAAAEEVSLEREALVERLVEIAESGNRAIAAYDAVVVEAGPALQVLMSRMSQAHAQIIQAKVEFIQVASRSVPEVGKPRAVLARTDRLHLAEALTGEVEHDADLSALALPWGSALPCSFESLHPKNRPALSGWTAQIERLFYENRSEILREHGQRLTYEALKRR